MNLQDTVSVILKKEVTEEEAKRFANDQFGVLAAYLKEDLKQENEKLKKSLKEVRADLFYQIESKHGPKAASKYPSIVEADNLL